MMEIDTPKPPKVAKHPRSKTVYRNVKLNMPDSTKIQIIKNHPSNFLQIIPTAHEKKASEMIDIKPPSIFYSFRDNEKPAFSFEVCLPNSTYQFQTFPQEALSKPRFLVYTFLNPVKKCFSAKITINTTTYNHIICDPMPMDFTNALEPFGTDNFLSVEIGSFETPFYITGIWASYRSISEIITDASIRNPFSALNPIDICPIKKGTVSIPAVGKGCIHTEVFDAVCYITKAQALNKWTCPICGTPIPLDDLCVDLTPSFGSMSYKSFDDIWEKDPL